MQPALSESQEDYLETILHLNSTRPAVRVKDIASAMTVTPSSVTGALQMLAHKGLVHYEPYEVVMLTPMGTAAAKRVAHRHNVTKDFLVKVLGIEESRAGQQACRLEHAFTKQLTRRLALFLEFLDLCPAGIERIAERFQQYCTCPTSVVPCEACRRVEHEM